MCTAADGASVELVAIYEIGKILGASDDVLHALPGTLGVLRERLGFQRAALMRHDGEGRLQALSSVGLDRTQLSRACYISNEGVVGKVFSTGEPCVIPDAGWRRVSAPGVPASVLAEASEHAAFVAVPVTAEGDVIGVLACDHTTDRISPRGSDSLRILSAVAGFVAERMSRSGEPAPVAKPERVGEACTGRVVAFSTAMRKILAEAKAAAATRSSVLLRGELGTGKETLAREIHRISARRDGPFVRVNCAMHTEPELEAELFGQESEGGSAPRRGALDLANGGTLFLEEIGGIAPALQTKLLHVLREREFKPLGGTHAHRADLRLICATSHDLEKRVVRGDFRAELYYQINVVSILLPPLRKRREDIPSLAEQVLERYNLENARALKVAPRAMRLLCNCNWPGNLRELENCLEHAATMAQDNLVATLPCDERRCLAQTLNLLDGDRPDAVADDIDVFPHRNGPRPRPPMAHPETLALDGEDGRLVNRDALVRVLEQCGWVQAKAARQLNITPRQVHYALQKYRIDVKKL